MDRRCDQRITQVIRRDVQRYFRRTEMPGEGLSRGHCGRNSKNQTDTGTEISLTLIKGLTCQPIIQS